MTNVTNQTTPDPTVYVVCLAAYNNGRHHGVTLHPAEQDADEMAAAIRDMLEQSPAPGSEEVIVTDFEDLPHDNMAQVFDLAKLADDAVAYVDLCEQYDRAAVDAYAGCHHGEDMENFEDAFAGVYDSTREFVDGLLDDAFGHLLDALPDWIVSCIDMDDVWEELSGDYWCANVPGGVAIFHYV